MTSFWQDLRFGFRTLFQRPGFTLIAVVTLGLGIGANTAIFSVINAALLRALPYPHEAQLVLLREKRVGEEDRLGNGASYLNFRDWQAQSQSFQRMAIVQSSEATLTGIGEPARVPLAVVSADIFSVLGLQPILGRAFAAADEVPGGSAGLNSVMLSHGAWQQRFGADQKIIGQKITLDNESFNVIGVLPAGIFPLQKEPIDFWITVAVGGDAKKQGTMNGSRGYRAYLAVLARMKPGVTVAQAQAEMTNLAQGLAAQYPASNANFVASVVPLRAVLVGPAQPLLLLLLGIVGAVLLIACANVANLLLARATTRGREMAIRAVLGASRWQLLRQGMTESLLLAMLGAILGLLLSLWGVDVLVAALPSDVPRITGLLPDWRVLLFTLGAALVTGLLCGLAPALSAARHDLSAAMKDGGRTATTSRGRLRSALVVGEIALALILLVGAGLLLKSFWRLQQVDPGFDYRQVLTAKVVLPF
ncbi:MAG: ABC transporter permease [Blastocatellia bacterium]